MNKYVVQVAKYNPRKGKPDVSHVYVEAHNKMRAVMAARAYLQSEFYYANRPYIDFNNDRMAQVWEYKEPVFINSEDYNELEEGGVMADE